MVSQELELPPFQAGEYNSEAARQDMYLGDEGEVDTGAASVSTYDQVDAELNATLGEIGHSPACLQCEYSRNLIRAGVLWIGEGRFKSTQHAAQSIGERLVCACTILPTHS